jgi:hypothetical protein
MNDRNHIMHETDVEKAFRKKHPFMIKKYSAY